MRLLGRQEVEVLAAGSHLERHPCRLVVAEDQPALGQHPPAKSQRCSRQVDQVHARNPELELSCAGRIEVTWLYRDGT